MVNDIATKTGDLPETWQRLGFRPGKTLRCFGMRRSGNHAILNWLQRNAPDGHALFLNNCRRGKDPLTSFATLEFDTERAPHRAAQKDLAAACAGMRDGAMLLFSYEDCTAAGFSIDRPVSGPFDETLIDADLYIYRGFLNWIASLAKKLSLNPTLGAAQRGETLLRSITLYTELLQQVQVAQELGIVPVCYDDWTGSETYRAGLLKTLGLPLRDNSLGQVQPYGGGSSFQKETEAPDDLQTGRRWLQMASDPLYQGVLHVAARDVALIEALEALFPADAEVLAAIAALHPIPQEVFQ
ncbi:hypothetical protein [Shimia sp.]|uniref:hypothetical protein n=1 Tax=Shimia sp. TaxID=1954381 RepID=UPI003563A3B6